jgi:glycosyltransferase involved in cell wall biosynthesis
MGQNAVFTVATPDYFAQAKAVILSAAEHNPKLEAFIFLLGENLKKENFRCPGVKVFFFDDLVKENPELYSLAFKLRVFNLCCALKPFFAEQLFRLYPSIKKTVYLDADMMVFSEMSEVFDRLSQASVVLTPHVLDPSKTLNDGFMPSEGRILSSGSFNMGFFAVSRTEEGLHFLRWWRQRTFFKCIRNFSEGYFDDQKWIDLVPGLFPNSHILKHPGYNVAYWNLHERTVTREQEGYRVNSEKLVIYHFSGWNIAQPYILSAHQNRFQLSENPVLKSVFYIYLQTLFKNGSIQKEKPKPPFRFFSNGLEIPEMVRDLYNQCMTSSIDSFGNPFQTSGEKSFFTWILKPDLDGLSPILRSFYNLRPDLRKNFGNLDRAVSKLGLIDWAISNGLAEFQFGPQWQKLLKVAFAQARGLIQGEAPVMRTDASVSNIGHGVNVIGFLNSEKGMGHSVRKTISCLKALSLPIKKYSYHDRRSQNLFQNQMGDFADFSVASSYAVNLIHLNAIDIGFSDQTYLQRMLKNRLNIGYWVWELESFPQKFFPHFRYFDEIWTPSRFSQSSILSQSPIPVVCMPHPISEEYQDRKFQSRKNGPFQFFFSFDFDSGYGRKNPEAVIAAFQLAFPKGSEKVQLMIKAARADMHIDLFRRLKTRIGDDKRIKLVNSVLSPTEYIRMQEQSDCFVSLHRSEGFGLTLLEGMALKKPVIATNYSGSTDFVTNQTGFPVNYRLVAIEQGNAPYEKGGLWADPDVQHAAEQMKLVYLDPKKAASIAEAGYRHVWKNNSIEAISSLYLNRLQLVGLNRLRRLNG